LVRVSILSNNLTRVSSIAELLAADDRIEVVDAPEIADVVIAAEFSSQDLPPHTGVVFLSDSSAAVLEPSGRAWLSTQVSSAELIAAVLAAAQDLTVLTPEQARQYLPGRRANGSARDRFVETLTQRELQVLKMLAAGLANKEIAGELGISDHTAKFHVAQILAKLGAGSRAEAVAIAIRRGLIPI
jgi:two-component system, NarL family, nitrate/nitrite response regulator NarL